MSIKCKTQYRTNNRNKSYSTFMSQIEMIMNYADRLAPILSKLDRKKEQINQEIDKYNKETKAELVSLKDELSDIKDQLLIEARREKILDLLNNLITVSKSNKSFEADKIQFEAILETVKSETVTLEILNKVYNSLTR